ncbi:MAG: glycine--tRNA ligase [Polyangia bacterium]
MPVEQSQLMEKLVSLTKRRGFIFQSSELYGGVNGAWDYGPLGVELKRNVKDAWWNAMVRAREDVVGLDSSILMHPMVWKASGHVSNFSDPMVDCRSCKKRFRCDEIAPNYEDDGLLPEKVGNPQCPEAKKPGTVGKSCDLTPARKFNLMFETHLGPVVESSAKTFLRPETAQGIFANFANVTSSTRVKVPFGIAQIGKSFRNEINPRNFTFRSREFEQMELEFFCKPGSDDQWFEYWVAERRRWYLELGMTEARLRFRAHAKEKLSHYAKGTTDVEYLFPFGWGELEGIANRTDYDLRQHQIGMRSVGKWDGGDLQEFQLQAEDPEYSKGKLSYFDDEAKERYIPFVIEPSAGADRATLAFLCDAYDEDDAGGEVRVVLRLHPKLAPVKAAILPLVNKEGMPERGRKLYEDLKKKFQVTYDTSAAIGKRYRRNDEIGTPFCFTIDGDTLTDGTVTLRERDSMKQERIAEDKVAGFLAEKLL